MVDAANGQLGFARERRGDVCGRARAVLRAEAAAHVLLDDAHLCELETECFGEIGAGVENALRGFPDGELIAEPFGHRPVRLHCAVQRNRSAILATHDDIGSRDRGVYVAPRRDSR